MDARQMVLALELPRKAVPRHLHRFRAALKETKPTLRDLRGYDTERLGEPSRISSCV